MGCGCRGDGCADSHQASAAASIVAFARCAGACECGGSDVWAQHRARQLAVEAAHDFSARARVELLLEYVRQGGWLNGD